VNTPAAVRILVVDDMPSIHEDFRRILINAPDSPELLRDEAMLFGPPASPPQADIRVEMDSAFQGREALDKVKEAVASGSTYALAFVDMRMPPGWGGVETIQRLREADPNLQVVVCTAYSDISWDQAAQQLGLRDPLVILQKPFEPKDVLRLASSLAASSSGGGAPAS